MYSRGEASSSDWPRLGVAEASRRPLRQAAEAPCTLPARGGSKYILLVSLGRSSAAGPSKSSICRGSRTFGFAVECLQLLVPGRWFSLLDLLANIGGTGFGAVFSLLFDMLLRWRRLRAV